MSCYPVVEQHVTFLNAAANIMDNKRVSAPPHTFGDNTNMREAAASAISI